MSFNNVFYTKFIHQSLYNLNKQIPRVPEKALTTAHYTLQQDMYPESALIKIQGDLQEDPLSELGEDYRCVNPSLEEELCAATPPFWSRIKEDHAHYYSKESLLWLAGGFGVGAIIANLLPEKVLPDLAMKREATASLNPAPFSPCLKVGEDGLVFVSAKSLFP
ncbi:MAG TPA: hypothetical protein DCM07_23205 [Planctomycetaceae bacterium]|uniref:hypothetical protein n=1 Tax=Gimesia sp. TaxID=2024833 RepID=UPI000C561067|nr:hypothetical protein [Gimesia sp.]MAX35673.1 hypothetical protein [Gimesia sp.]HAH47710.1 hypothetical protein [Planctomycetaceae bacterium]|tara:strand:- start:3965 stop:4456 length:492 start_codon:yes stop_codon:yes gene_type:complete